MPLTPINGVQIFWERHGDSGAPLVLVHGSWGDHHNWDAVVPSLARTFRVFTYDRRGHSHSERPATPGSLPEDAADLAAFIRTHGLAPAHVAGNSFGAAVALTLAAAEPELLASLTVHEPPLIGMIETHPMMPAIRERIAVVLAMLSAGDMEGGAQQFVDTIALGPGMWEKLPAEMRRTFVFNAPTWLDEMDQGESAMTVDVSRLSTFSRPALLTKGTQSPPFFAAVLDRIAAALPHAAHHTFDGAGHVPHISHADEYVRVVSGFIQAIGAPRPTAAL